MSDKPAPPQIFADAVGPAIDLIENFGMMDFLAQYAGFLASMIADYDPLLWEKTLQDISTFAAGTTDPNPTLTAAFVHYLQLERDDAILSHD